MWTSADELRSRSGLDEVVKRTRNSLHLRVDRTRTLALCTSPGGPPLHLRDPKTGLWVPAEQARPSWMERFLEWLNRPLVDLALGPLAAMPDFTPGVGGYLRMYGGNATYSTARSTYSGGDSILYCGQNLTGGTYYCYRTWLKFDTSSITVDNTVSQVNLKLTVTVDNSAVDYDVDIVKHGLNYTPQEACYDAFLSAALDNSIWRNTSGLALNTPYTSGNLDPTFVNRTGITYYGLLAARDRDGSGTAPTGDEHIQFVAPADSHVERRPTLIVTYAGTTTFVPQIMRHHFIPSLGPVIGG